jgi:hypothetical protein
VPEEDPRPRDVLAHKPDEPDGPDVIEHALPDQVERLEEQEQQAEPESWEAPDAG